MQYSRYLPGYHYPRDHNAGLNGNSWSIPHKDIDWNSSRGFNIPLPQFTMNQYQDLVHQKDILRQMILKHEAVFRYQVNELHRVYGRQRELMTEIQRRKLAEDHLRLQASESNTFIPQLRSDISEKTYWSKVNLTSIKPSEPSKELFQEYLSSTVKSVQPGGDHLSGQNVSKECNISSSKSNTSRKRMLDLELPAEDYIDNEEAEPFEDKNTVKRPNIMTSELQPHHYSKVSFVTPGDSSNFLSSCRGTSLLFDLNEPAQPDESGCLNSALETETVHEEIRNLDQDLSVMPTTECSKLNKEDFSSASAGRDGSGLHLFDEDTSVGRELTCSQQASLPQKIADKNNDEIRTDKSLLVSSTTAIQALPCFTTEASLSSNPKSSVRNSTLAVKKFNPYQVSASTLTSGSVSSGSMPHGFSDSTCEHIAAVNGIKVSDYASCKKDMDLNLTPPTKSEHQSASTSNISHLDFLQVKNVEIHKNSEILDSNMAPDSTPESTKCTTLDHLVSARIDSKLSTTSICTNLNSCIKEEPLLCSAGEVTEPIAERDLEGPVSPENKECSPPRGDSSDIITNTSVRLSKRGQIDPIEELDRVAADILIFISSSVVQRYSKTAISETSEVSSDYLGWLAEVATSLASNPENEEFHFESDVLLSDRTDCKRSMKLNMRGEYIHNSHCHVKVAKEKVDGSALCNLPRRGQARRTKDQRDFQTDAVPAIVSLLHGASETSNSPKTGTLRKSPSRTSSRGVKRLNDRERTVCSLLQQHTSDNKHGIKDRFLKGWGLTKRRKKAQRAQSSVYLPFL